LAPDIRSEDSASAVELCGPDPRSGPGEDFGGAIRRFEDLPRNARTPLAEKRQFSERQCYNLPFRRDLAPMIASLASSPLRAQAQRGRARIRGEAASSAGQSPRTEAGRGLPRLGRAEGELGLDAEALTHLDLCLKEYPPSEDRRVQEARVKFYDLRLQIRDRCKKMGCSYRDPAPSSGLGEEPRPVVKPTTTQETKAPEKKEVPKEFAPPPEGKPKAPSAKWPVVISTAAVGAVGVGLGGGFFVASEGKKSEAVGLREDLIDGGIRCETRGIVPCDEYGAMKQSYFDLQTAGIAATAVGGGLLVTSAILAVVWPQEGGGGVASFRPVVSVSDRASYFGVAGSF
jgi:hypothetical protein